ncbi:hypothetical protein JXB12_05870 [candidate division KSB1 bacterium]|nr:hypothetical protein [candidate division KSB1 bacterium]
MEKRLRLIGVTSLLLGIFSLSWLVFDFIAFNYVRPKVIDFSPLGAGEELAKYIFIGIIVSFFFHFVSFIYLIHQFQYFKKIALFRILTLFAGVVSFICLIGDWAALIDIGRQYQAGLSTSMEWGYLYSSLIVHVLYYILFMILFFRTAHDLKNPAQHIVVLKDEVIFKLAQYVGFVCGVIGLCFTLLIFYMSVRPAMLKYLIPFYGSFIIFPYCFIFVYWLLTKRHKKLAEWYDEKQWWDIARASLITLILLIPGMAALFFINYIQSNSSIQYIWFPYYLFMMLMFFSGSILYYSRENV